MTRFLPLTLILSAGPAAAAEPGKIIGGADVVSMILSTLVVVAAIVALGWAWSKSKFAVTGSRDVINIVSSRALGTKERLLLIEVADQQLLVGMTATQVQTLHVFEKPVVDTTAVTPAPASFADRLRSTMREARQ